MIHDDQLSASSNSLASVATYLTNQDPISRLISGVERI